jgi:6-phosphogluconate dehydrogenase (decarboxylating)
MGRDVRQRTQWDSDGTAVARTWAKSAQLRTYLRSLTLEELKALLVTLK